MSTYRSFRWSLEWERDIVVRFVRWSHGRGVPGVTVRLSVCDRIARVIGGPFECYYAISA